MSITVTKNKQNIIVEYDGKQETFTVEWTDDKGRPIAQDLDIGSDNLVELFNQIYKQNKEKLSDIEEIDVTFKKSNRIRNVSYFLKDDLPHAVALEDKKVKKLQSIFAKAHPYADNPSSQIDSSEECTDSSDDDEDPASPADIASRLSPVSSSSSVNNQRRIPYAIPVALPVNKAKSQPSSLAGDILGMAFNPYLIPR